uniref:cytosolic 5'-nucleotidase 3-like isoform X2 n=1 Tax=Styela clava TaxID=7725 RepID=UPI00193985B1|nr:cytosolic 5'-nucleotidase 3-like isoform X2 [Styela clava]
MFTLRGYLLTRFCCPKRKSCIPTNVSRKNSFKSRSFHKLLKMSDNPNKLEKILGQRHVSIKNPEIVRKKIETLIKGGASSLQVISDFDKTISKYRHLNKRCPSSHCIIETHSVIPQEIKEEMRSMAQKYYAIETDHNLTVEDKIPHMIDWNEKGTGLFIKAGVKREHLPHMVKDSDVCLRDGFVDLVDTLHKSNVPLLIFSAGVADVVEEVIRQQASVHPNMKIVANTMDFDQKGALIGFKGELLHPFNKNESALEGDPYFEEIRHRHNVILLGDSIGDLTMANGVPGVNVSLKIGFLNAKFEELLDTFMDGFDIVLEDDQTMEVVNAILEEIMG